MHMKITVVQNTSIIRYDGTYSTFPSFFMAPTHTELDREQVSARGTGEGSLTEDGVTVTYTEEANGARVSVALSFKDGELTVRRGGSEMRFVRGATTRFSYSVGYGYLPMVVYTEALSRQDKGEAHLITLAYLSITDGMASRTEIRFKINEEA